MRFGGTNNLVVLQSCPETMVDFVQNMTASYANKGNESSVVSSSVIMFILAAVFFDVNLFSRISRVSAVLNPTIRLFLTGSLNLFLPVMSYLFSEAKKPTADDCGSNNIIRQQNGSDDDNNDLPLLARVILTWMLLVELLRKKVEATLVTGAGMQGSSNIISHAASVVWMGNLVFTNLKASGTKALFGILWVLCAAKLVQRVAIAETARRSLAHGKNARLISSYMAQLPKLRPILHGGAGASSLEQCEYAVMGEENMVLKAGPHGYELNLAAAADVVTVGKIWQTSFFEEDNPRLKRLCLSFALFKLLRRRFENLPAMTKRETHECRDLVFDGLCKKTAAAAGDDDIPAEVAIFQVLNDEMNFVTEYYHSVLPVVFASPYFIVVNYLCFPVVVFGLCVMTIVLCGNGNISYAFQSLRDDNVAISMGIISLTKCLWENVVRSPKVFFAIIDVSICYLLFIAVIYEEVSEIVVFLLSDWFMVSLLSTFSAKPRWRQSTTFRAAMRCVLWVRRNLRHYPSLVTMKQLSMLGMCGLSDLTLPTATMPKRAKRYILKRFRGQDDGNGGGAAPLSNGRAALSMDKHRERFSGLAWACGRGGVAEVILTWHIATALLERKHSPRPEERRSRRTAARLSKYCAYLVAFRPELLPDDREGTESVYKDMKEQLKAALGGTWWSYYSSSERTRHEKIQAIPDKLPSEYRHADLTVLQKGAALGKVLVDEAGKAGNSGGAAVWEMLADVWVELVVYVAPSSVEEHAKGHETALVQGGELVTLLWVLATHTGIARPDDDEVDQPAPAFV